MADEAPGSATASTLSSLLGLGASIGGLVPSITKTRSQSELEKVLSGRGAGALLARQMASEQARQAFALANSQSRDGRGLRTALQAADRANRQGVAQAAAAASREQLSAAQALGQREDVRNRAFADAGSRLGEGLATFGAVQGVAANAPQEEFTAADRTALVGSAPELPTTSFQLQDPSAQPEARPTSFQLESPDELKFGEGDLLTRLLKKRPLSGGF